MVLVFKLLADHPEVLSSRICEHSPGRWVVSLTKNTHVWFCFAFLLVFLLAWVYRLLACAMPPLVMALAALVVTQVYSWFGVFCCHCGPKKIKILLVREKIVIWWIGRSLGICVLVLFVAFRGTSNESPGMSAISLAVAFVICFFVVLGLKARWCICDLGVVTS